MTPNERVRAAIDLTATTPALADHWQGLLTSRVPGAGASGSVFHVDSAEDLVARLRAARWEPLDHPGVRPPAIAFRTRDVAGHFGLVDLTELPSDAEVHLRDAHATGFLSAEVRGALGEPTDGATILLGPDGAGEVVWTFHPGLPVAPSTVAVGSVAVGSVGGRETVTAGEALAMGLRWAKVSA